MEDNAYVMKDMMQLDYSVCVKESKLMGDVTDVHIDPIQNGSMGNVDVREVILFMECGVYKIKQEIKHLNNVM